MAPRSSSLSQADEADRPTAPLAPILLVEDNSGDILLVRELLKEHNIANELHVATDGQKAIEFLNSIGKEGHSVCPALLILDLNLPKKSGREVLAHMRAIAGCVGVPVLVLSSSNAPADRETALELGAQCYIRKPSDLADFMEIGVTIRRLLSRYSPERP